MPTSVSECDIGPRPRVPTPTRPLLVAVQNPGEVLEVLPGALGRARLQEER
ncbi:hypothetical protein ACL02T_05650 [Pseudonocardia sp. RS010]|uniref:hypothetical protein n=1 Tax=Pseudonocardia sp. RS010 TaxID=3385979 RepID=UPI00399FB720